MIFLYRLLFPVVFLFFLPGQIWKLIRRPGYKKTWLEKFGFYSKARKEELAAWRNSVWIHAVSVGETNLALTLINAWVKDDPSIRIVLSTTTTTAQEIARNKAPKSNVNVIFAPIDCYFTVRKVLNLLVPSRLVIFETELWPNMVLMSAKRGMKLTLVNTRISDKSFKGYKRFKRFFAPLLASFDTICAQSDLDAERLKVIASDKCRVVVTGNIKFDQKPPASDGFDYDTVFGKDHGLVVIGASTHQPEEKLIVKAFAEAKKKRPDAKLIIVPRHAERGGEIENLIASTGMSYHRRSRTPLPDKPVEILLADTTGELALFIKSSDVVIMGKTLCGNDEGQNIIEPAVMGKPIICGRKLRNFRQALDLLVRYDGVMRLSSDDELYSALDKLLGDEGLRKALGERAEKAMAGSRGALAKTLAVLEK